MIAALFVDPKGVYASKGVDCWGTDRDARRFAGPGPVVAHPPCARWCKFAGLVQARYGYRIGDDGGCFRSAFESVAQFGGVLEHPAYSIAWEHFGITRPKAGGWIQGGPRHWVCEVAQSIYGHRARKRTWLLYVGSRPPFDLRWEQPKGEAWVSHGERGRGYRDRPRCTKKEASATPPAFADELIRLAEWSRGL